MVIKTLISHVLSVYITKLSLSIYNHCNKVKKLKLFSFFIGFDWI